MPSRVHVLNCHSCWDLAALGNAIHGGKDSVLSIDRLCCSEYGNAYRAQPGQVCPVISGTRCAQLVRRLGHFRVAFPGFSAPSQNHNQTTLLSADNDISASNISQWTDIGTATKCMGFQHGGEMICCQVTTMHVLGVYSALYTRLLQISCNIHVESMSKHLLPYV